MSNEYIISIDTTAKLSVDTGRLAIDIEGKKHYVAIVDIAILILESPFIQLSAPVFSELSLVGTIVLGVDASRMPCYVTAPIGINKQGAKRPHQQVRFIDSAEERKWWDSVLQSKIRGQYINMKLWGGGSANAIEAYCKEVVNGDERNIEGAVAKVYWKDFFALLGKKKCTREKEGAEDSINAGLNYGYAIMRAMIARSLVSAGFCLNFGIGHYRKDNPFNLVEDFIEPFRPFIDAIIFALLQDTIDANDGLTSTMKQYILKEILALEIVLGNKKYRIFNAIDCVVYSFAQALDDSRRALVLPNTEGVRTGKVAKNPVVLHKKYAYE